MVNDHNFNSTIATISWFKVLVPKWHQPRPLPPPPSPPPTYPTEPFSDQRLRARAFYSRPTQAYQSAATGGETRYFPGLAINFPHVLCSHGFYFFFSLPFCGPAKNASPVVVCLLFLCNVFLVCSEFVNGKNHHFLPLSEF